MIEIGVGLWVVSFGLALVLTRFIRDHAPRWGLVDLPDPRKVHVHPTPLGGGIAMYLATVVPILGCYVGLLAIRAAGLADEWLPAAAAVHAPGVLGMGPTLGAVLLGATVVMVVGVIDDRRGLDYRIRLAVQTLVAIGVVLAGVQITGFISVRWLSGALTVLWIVGLTNAFNFLDHMDGLSAGVACIAAAVFLLLMVLLEQWFVAALLVVLIGSLAGFLVFNLPPASIFMGDGGSNFIGFMLAVITVVSTFYQARYPLFTFLAPLCVLAVPIFDSAMVISIRLREGRSPFHPDKRHMSHRLVELGLEPRNAVGTIYLITLSTGLGALLLYQVGRFGALVILMQIVLMLAVITVLETAGRKDKQNGSPQDP